MLIKTVENKKADSLQGRVTHYLRIFWHYSLVDSISTHFHELKCLFRYCHWVGNLRNQSEVTHFKIVPIVALSDHW